MLDPLGLYEYKVVTHVHSTLSDGTGTPDRLIREAQRAGIDVLWLTDHDTLKARESPGEGYYGHLLFLVGAEITPPQNHYLAFGIDSLVSAEKPLQSIIDHVRSEKAFGVIAHPTDRGNRTARLPSYRWSDRDVDGFDGFEILNHLSDWSRRVPDIPRGLIAALTPHRHLQASDETLALWDKWGEKRAVVGIGGVDAHAAHVGHWPFRLTIFPYRVAFRSVRTHVYTESPLSSDWMEARLMILSAMKQGRVMIANAAHGQELGFRLWAENTVDDRACAMGSEVAYDDGPYLLRGLSPVPCGWEIVCNGAVMGVQQTTVLEWPIDRPGVWRVVLRRDREVWIYSNPIYVR